MFGGSLPFPGEHAQAVPLRVMVHRDLREPRLCQVVVELSCRVDLQAVDDLLPLSSEGSVSSDLSTMRNALLSTSTRYTSAKLSTGPGQKYTVSNVVARSRVPPNGK